MKYLLIILITALSATTLGYLTAEPSLRPVPGTLELPSRGPVFSQIVYRWPDASLQVGFASGCTYELGEVPIELAGRFLDVEDKEGFFRRHLLSSYEIREMRCFHEE